MLMFIRHLVQHQSSVKNFPKAFLDMLRSKHGVYQILDTEPYLNQNRGQIRHARGPRFICFINIVSNITVSSTFFRANQSVNG